MNRRRVVLAGIAAAASTPALAQGPASPVPASPDPAERRPNQELRGTAGGTTPEQQRRLQMEGAPQDRGVKTQAGAQQGQVSQEQAQAGARYVRDTLAAGTVSLQQTTFARTKAQHPRVKQFVAFEEDEQNQLTEVLHSLSDPRATASTSNATAGAASTAPVLSNQAAQIMERFSRAKPGQAFDRDYVAAQIQGHTELLAVQDRYLQAASGGRELTSIARMARGRIQEHLAMLQDIQQELGG
jgi:putative membrane protein